jgi:dipeptidyl-peptidase-4
VRTFERVTPAGSRTTAVDRAATWSSLEALVGEPGLPDALAWSDSIDRAGRRAAYVFGDDLLLLDLATRAESRLTSKPAVPRVIPQRYPKPGGTNPSVRLGIVDVRSGATAWMDPEAAPSEYLVAVEWSPDSRRVAVQAENRTQTRLDLYFVDRKLTKGPWSVRGPGAFTTAPLGSIAAVDEARGLVYFTALEQSPVERHPYRVQLDGSGLERLSREDGVHRATLSPDARGSAG